MGYKIRGMAITLIRFAGGFAGGFLIGIGSLFMGTEWFQDFGGRFLFSMLFIFPVVVTLLVFLVLKKHLPARGALRKGLVSGVIVFILLMLFLSFGLREPTKSRDARRAADVRQLQTALELYADDHRRYPNTLEELAPDYISAVPEDPATGDNYLYKTDEAQKQYLLRALFENEQYIVLDSDNDLDGTIFGLDCDDPLYCVQQEY